MDVEGIFSLQPLRIIAGKRKGKPNAYGASLTYSIMRKRLFSHSGSVTVSRPGDGSGTATQTRAGK